MATATFPISLDVKTPPMFPSLQGGQVINSGPQDGQDKPIIVWMQNALPTLKGVSSVEYNTYVDATNANAADQASMMRVYTIWDEISSKATYYFYANGEHVVLDPIAKTWSTLASGGDPLRPISIVYVRGKSYVFDGVEVYKFAEDFTSMIAVPLTGIDILLMLGFTSAMDYAIGWDADSVYWSEPGNPGQFTPLTGTVRTGAGASRIVELIGKIKWCQRIAGGFIVYGSVNIVSARYSGNSNNPWIFKGLESSAAITRLDGIYASDSAANHFAFTNEGIKQVTLQKCENVFSELGKMLSGWVYYTSNGDGTFTKVESTDGSELIPLTVKCAFVGDTYFCISFAAGLATSFPFAFIYDVGLEQWGMLKVDHVDMFEFVDVFKLSGTASGASGWGLIGVLSPEGKIYSVKPTEVDTKLTPGFESISEFIVREIRATRNRTSQVNIVQMTGYKDFSGSEGNGVRVKSYFDAPAGNDEVVYSNVPIGSDCFIETTVGYFHQLRITGKFNLTSASLELGILGNL